MNWKQYSRKFHKKAILNGYLESEIAPLLSYGEKLFNLNLPIIYDQTHLSLLLGYDIGYLRKVSNSSNKFYRNFEINKKNGGKRNISEPLPNLKEIQRWILDNILSKVKVSKYSKAYIKNRSIKSNASYHVNKNTVLRLDITNFFGSIKYSRIYKVFSNLGYSNSVSVMLAKICTYKNRLPQGAPTSPALSNIIFTMLDLRIANFTKVKGIMYTRYADDLTFSGTFEPGMVIKFVKMVLKENKLELNPFKINAQKPHQRQMVTGIVVNKKMQVPRKIRRKLRQSVYYIEKFGISSHLEKTKNLKANHVYHLMGIANFILFVNPDDKEASQYLNKLKSYLPENQ